MDKLTIRWLMWFAALTIAESKLSGKSDLEARVNQNSDQIVDLSTFAARTQILWEWKETNRGKFKEILSSSDESSSRNTRRTVKEMETKILEDQGFLKSLEEKLIARLKDEILDDFRKELLTQCNENMKQALEPISIQIENHSKKVEKISEDLETNQMNINIQASKLEELSDNQTTINQALEKERNIRIFENNKDAEANTTAENLAKQLQQLKQTDARQQRKLRNLTDKISRLETTTIPRLASDISSLKTNTPNRVKRDIDDLKAQARKLNDQEIPILKHTLNEHDNRITQNRVAQNNSEIEFREFRDQKIPDLEVKLRDHGNRINQNKLAQNKADNIISTISNSRLPELKRKSDDLEKRLGLVETTPGQGDTRNGKLRAHGSYTSPGDGGYRTQQGRQTGEARDLPVNLSEGHMIPGSGVVFDPSSPHGVSPLIPYNPGDPVPYMPYGNLGDPDYTGDWEGFNRPSPYDSMRRNNPSASQPMGDSSQTGPMSPNNRGEFAGRGLRRESGSRGTSGGQGNRGFAGQPGANGQPGTSGALGLPGDRGSPGQPGSPGQRGSQGGRGSPGGSGSRGTSGPAGPAGSPGQPGQPGSPGPSGLPGQRG